MSTTQQAGVRIYTDSLTRRLYANDASMYEELPMGVAYPKSGDELAQLVHEARRLGSSITARTAGTSLAGQTTGDGVIADCSRFMNRILDIDPETSTATMEPGVIRDALNREAKAFGLKFGPDTSTTNRCMLGGMIGNNSAGLYSLKYGSVRDHIISVDAVLSDGSQVRFEPLNPEQLSQKMGLDSLEGEIYRETITLLKKHKEEILKTFPHPEIIRRNTGYAIDKLCEMDPVTPGGRPFNLAELLCGSEGTLALMEKATVRLVPDEPHRVLLIPHFSSVHEAMEATVLAVRHAPAAVELIDDIILNATKNNLEQQRNRFFLEGEPACLLIIEFEGSDPEQLLANAQKTAKSLADAGLGYSYPTLEKPDEMKRVWDLRKAGLGLLMGLSADSRTPTFAEDTAVRVEDLPAYIRAFEALMKKHETHCVFYAHASVGELHLRPAIDISKEEGVQKMERMAAEVADLVQSFRGSLSGEHGDGRARAPFIRLVIGDEMVALLEKIKHIWDPENVFNPGKIVHPKPMREGLRFSPDEKPVQPKTIFKWQGEGGFSEALDLCNGAGVCRKTHHSGGTMCPSYMATLEEKDSTRGRANVFRQLFKTRNAEAFESEEIRDALSYCLSCKACKSECPANVDMARMKAEFMQGWHNIKGVNFATRFWTNPFPFLKLGALMPRISNAIAKSSAGHFVLEKLAGLHPERPLPAFATQSFSAWVKQNYSGFNRNREAQPEVLLLVDPFTDLHRPEQAIAAMKVLHRLGFNLRKPLVASTGRTYISGGRPAEAVKVLNQLLPNLAETARRGFWIVGLEPSELLTLRDEATDLRLQVSGADIRLVASKSLLFEEFIDRFADDAMMSRHFRAGGASVLVHGHCYVKALTGTSALNRTLRKAGYQPEEVDSGCCGMAGSFGYRKETFTLSQTIGEQRLMPAIRKLDEGKAICAHGFSCQHQIKDGAKKTALHPAELLESVMR
ncbi:MAG: FAD-binding protein [Balneolia bacterium]|nr:FAD-binding protein [Balneolia bacterium]